MQCVLDFLVAKQLSGQWTDVCRCAMLKFRRFLRHRRGQVESQVTHFPTEHYSHGLPDWLGRELERLQHIKERNWRPARLDYAIRSFWSGHIRLWHFLIERYGVHEINDIHRQYLHDFIDERLISGAAVSTINSELRNFHSLMTFLQSQGYTIPLALLRMHTLKEPEPLPRYLTDEQVSLLRQEIERRVAQATEFRQRRDALLDRAAFYLFWQSGLRIGEVEELRLEDLDLAGRRLSVRQSKGLKDRTVYLTHATVQALKEYLAVRGPGPTDHVFLYRNQAVSKDLLRGHLKAAGKQAGVDVYPHRLRHTTATQLLNAGCRITSIQKLLGHKDLKATMIYARVHDQTVAEDYYQAMQRIEQRLELLGEPEKPASWIGGHERGLLMELATQLAQLELSLEARLDIAAQMSDLLTGREAIPLNENGRKQNDVLSVHLSPSPALLGSG